MNNIEEVALDKWNAEPDDFRDLSEFTDYKVGFIAGAKWQAAQLQSRAHPQNSDIVQDLTQLQHELVADMPTGEIKTWDVVTVVTNHSLKLIKLIEKYDGK